MLTIYPKSIEELKAHILSKSPSIYVSSRTSTVIPFEQMEKHLTIEEYCVDLSSMPKRIDLIDNKLFVSGAVSWHELKVFANSKGKRVLTNPTDQSASVLAGLATSCTGEISFGFGTLRDQVQSLKYLNHRAEEIEVRRVPLKVPEDYQKAQNNYDGFKNAPFPKLTHEVDLLIGTEGQLGVITECVLDCVDQFNDIFLLIPLKRWEDDYSLHLEILKSVQSYRSKIVSCELLDSNALKFADADLKHSGDYIVLQVKEEYFEQVYEEILAKLSLDLENIIELNSKAFHELRVSIPRLINENNSRKGIIKRGTDVQVGIEQFPKLLDIYREFSKMGVNYNLFGHFGDCHLHFNFLPLKEQSEKVDLKLRELYEKVLEMNGSPFAEHGIGIIKQSYVQKFWSQEIREYLRDLKKMHDPDQIFFPSGFMRDALMT